MPFELLGAVGSIAGLVSLAGQAVETSAQLHHFFSGVHKGAQELKDLVAQLAAAHTVLVEIRHIITSSQLRECMKTEHASALLQCLEGCSEAFAKIWKLKRKFDSNGPSTQLSWRMRFTLEFKKMEIKDALEKLETQKSTMTLIIVALGM